MTSLCIKDGGLGLYSILEVTSYAFVIYRARSLVLHDRILRDGEIYFMNSDFDRILDGLSGTMSGFDLSGFTSKELILPKA